MRKSDDAGNESVCEQYISYIQRQPSAVYSKCSEKALIIAGVPCLLVKMGTDLTPLQAETVPALDLRCLEIAHIPDLEDDNVRRIREAGKRQVLCVHKRNMKQLQYCEIDSKAQVDMSHKEGSISLMRTK